MIAKLFARPQSRRDRRRHPAHLGLEPLEARDVPTGMITVEALGTANEDGTGSPMFRFTRTGSLADPTYGGFNVGGTATHNTDYTISQYLYFPVGEDTWDVPITVLDDSLFEGATAETITASGLYLFGNYTPGSPGTAQLEIVDDDPAPTVSVVAFGNAVEGGVSGTFRLARTGDTSAALTVGYTVVTSGNGQATPGDDYYALSGSVTFPSGWDAVNVSVSAYDDSLVESDETVTIVLGASTAYTLGDPMAADLSIRDIHSGVISGLAWADVDDDGIQGEDEFGLAEATATLLQNGTPCEASPRTRRVGTPSRALSRGRGTPLSSPRPPSTTTPRSARRTKAWTTPRTATWTR